MMRLMLFMVAGCVLAPATGYAARDKYVDCDQSYSDVKNGLEVARSRGVYEYASGPGMDLNTAREIAVNDALSQMILGRLKSEALVLNFVLTKQFIEVQRDGFVQQYRVLDKKDYEGKLGRAVSVCVEASVRPIAFELTKEFLQNPPSLMLAVVSGNVGVSGAREFLDGVYSRLRDTYGGGVLLPPRQEGDSGVYQTVEEALLASNGQADFLIAFSGLNFSERASRIKTMELAISRLSLYTLSLGNAAELPFFVSGESRGYSGLENVAGRKKIAEELQGWSVARIDELIKRSMSDGNKIIAFADQLSFEQYSLFLGILEKATAGIDDKTWGKPIITPKPDKNYFRVQWRGTTFELAQALAAQLNNADRKFNVERVNFQTVLVSLVSIAKDGTGK